MWIGASHTAATALCAALAVALVETGASFAASPEIVPAREKEAAKVETSGPWLDLKDGLEASRKEQLPIVLVYAPSAPDRPNGGSASADSARDSTGREKESLAETFEGFLSNSFFKKTLRGFALIRVEPDELDAPYPHPPAAERTDEDRERTPRGKGQDGGRSVKDRGRRGVKRPPRALGRSPTPVESVRRKLALKPEVPSLLVLSFREEVVARHEGHLPKRSVLRKELSRIAKVNEVFAKEDRRVGAILEKSLYAFQSGKRKAAVQLVLPLQKPRWRRRMDDVLKERVDAVIESYRKVAETEMTKGDLLDGKRQYKEALDVFEVVLQEFPFPDIRKRAAVRKGEIWRKVQIFTRIPR